MILTMVSNKQLCQSRLRFWGILLSLLPLSSFSLSKKDLFVQYHDIGVNPARARSAWARRACALRALGLLLADGTPTVGGGKTF